MYGHLHVHRDLHIVQRRQEGRRKLLERRSGPEELLEPGVQRSERVPRYVREPNPRHDELCFVKTLHVHGWGSSQRWLLPGGLRRLRSMNFIIIYIIILLFFHNTNVIIIFIDNFYYI